MWCSVELYITMMSNNRKMSSISKIVPVGDKIMIQAYGQYMTRHGLPIETQGVVLPPNWSLSWEESTQRRVEGLLAGKKGEATIILMNTSPDAEQSAPHAIAANVGRLSVVLRQSFKVIKIMLDVPDNAPGWNPYYDSVINATRMMWARDRGLDMADICAPHLKGVDIASGGPPRTISGCLTVEAATYHIGQVMGKRKGGSSKRKSSAPPQTHKMARLAKTKPAPAASGSHTYPTNSAISYETDKQGPLSPTVSPTWQALLSSNKAAWEQVAQLKYQLGQAKPDSHAIQVAVSKCMSNVVMPSLNKITSTIEDIEARLNQSERSLDTPPTHASEIPVEVEAEISQTAEEGPGVSEILHKDCGDTKDLVTAYGGVMGYDWEEEDLDLPLHPIPEMGDEEIEATSERDLLETPTQDETLNQGPIEQ